MKKVLFIITIILLAIPATGAVEAVSPTVAPTAAISPTKAVSPTSGNKILGEKLDEQINELKEKIASRVSELKLVEKRAIIGTVSEVTTNKITLTDMAGKTRIADVDEITKFSSPGKTSFGLSDLTKGTRVSVLGIYNKQSKRILARFIETTIVPQFVSGAIFSIDSKNFQLMLITEDQKKIKIDIVTTSKILSYKKGEDLAKLGFSKLEVGDRINVIGYFDKKDKSMIVAGRLLIFTDLPKNPKVIVPQPTVEEEDVVVSTGSGKKLTPIKN